MSKIWLASDQHFGHKRITDFEPLRAVIARQQGYDDWEQCIIDNHNKLVAPDDQVILLGDFAWAGTAKWLNKLDGYKTFVIGNHDNLGPFFTAPQTDVVRGIWYVKNGRRYEDTGYKDPKLSGLIMDFGDYTVMFTHYALFYKDVYDEQKSINDRKDILEQIARDFKIDYFIHGHLHSKLTGSPDTYNVCLEHSNLAPVELSEVLDRLVYTTSSFKSRF